MFEIEETNNALTFQEIKAKSKMLTRLDWARGDDTRVLCYAHTNVDVYSLCVLQSVSRCGVLLECLARQHH